MAGANSGPEDAVTTHSTDVARVHITTNPAAKCGRVELHSVLAPGVVQRSALLQGISESSGESSLPVDQSDIFGWLHVVTRRADDVGGLYSHGVLPDMSKPASVLSVRTQATGIGRVWYKRALEFTGIRLCRLLILWAIRKRIAKLCVSWLKRCSRLFMHALMAMLSALMKQAVL